MNTVKIRLLPGNLEFEQRPGESLLEAALRGGVTLDYSCASGTCGRCKARRVSGDFVKLRPHDATLSESERARGDLLLCSYAATGEAAIEIGAAADARSIPHQRIETRVRKLETLPGDVLLLHLRTPRSQTLDYLAGQCVTLTLADGGTRTLAVASCPCDPMNLQFHLRPADDPAFHARARALRNGDTVRVNGPEGAFTFSGHTAPSVTFIAVESGFAPIKSLLEHVLSLELPQRVQLIWRVRRADDLYLDNYCRALADALENFAYLPVITADVESALGAPLDQYATADGEFYVAAPPAQASLLTDMLTKRGVASRQLHVTSRY
jgi:CDP-4-dehydro-6-deoxyglucose reductase